MITEALPEARQIVRKDVSIYMPPRLVETPAVLKDGEKKKIGVLCPGEMSSAEYILETFIVAGATPIIRTYNATDDTGETNASVSNALEPALFVENWGEIQKANPGVVLAICSYLGMSNRKEEAAVGSQSLIFLDMECAPSRRNLDWTVQSLAMEGFTGAVINSGNSFQYVSDFRVPEKNFHLFLADLVGILTPFIGLGDPKRIMKIVEELNGASLIQDKRRVGRAIITPGSETYIPSVKLGAKPIGSFLDLRYLGHRLSDESLGDSLPFMLRLSSGPGKPVPYVWAIVE